MTEDKHDQNNHDPVAEVNDNPENAVEELDAAGRSLSEALRISFVILQVIMVVLLVVFVASGFRRVESDERAMVLRFGKIQGIAEDRILGPGLHWVWPYPIEELVRIPIEKKINLPIESFWYYLSPREKLNNEKGRVMPTLNPLRDGYCLTRGEKKELTVLSDDDNDYNIVHTKWQLVYRIDDPELFFRNMYVRETKPGEVYMNVMRENVEPLLQNLLEDAVVSTMVHFTIDEARSSDSRIPARVSQRLTKKLRAIESGIEVVTVQLTDVTWPRKVDAAFQNYIRASQRSRTEVSEAKTYAEKTVNEVGGPIAEELLEALREERANEAIEGFSGQNVTEQGEHLEALWTQLSGEGQAVISQAKAYRTKVVETAKANAEYFQQLLPEYEKRPKLVLQRLYRDAIDEVLANADEKFLLQRTKGDGRVELRVMLNRDPDLKTQKKDKQDD